MYGTAQTDTPTQEELFSAAIDTFADIDHFLNWVSERYGQEAAKEQAGRIAAKLLAYSQP